jgi:fructose-1,6-bisphosphatase I
LLKSGISLYPGDAKSPRGKLRLPDEAAPLAFIVEQAGGAACDGEQPIMNLQASELHQRTPLFIGSCEDVATLEEFAQGKRALEGMEDIRVSSI